MSTAAPEAIKSQVLTLLAQLASDWEYEDEITEASFLFSELGFQSLDIVVLGNTLQEQYDCIIPYTDLFADMGQREVRDITVGEWIDFTARHVNHGRPGDAV